MGPSYATAIYFVYGGFYYFYHLKKKKTYWNEPHLYIIPLASKTSLTESYGKTFASTNSTLFALFCCLSLQQGRILKFKYCDSDDYPELQTSYFWLFLVRNQELVLAKQHGGHVKDFHICSLWNQPFTFQRGFKTCIFERRIQDVSIHTRISPKLSRNEPSQRP
jgi:hypothetical protein